MEALQEENCLSTLTDTDIESQELRSIDNDNNFETPSFNIARINLRNKQNHHAHQSKEYNHDETTDSFEDQVNLDSRQSNHNRHSVRDRLNRYSHENDRNRYPEFDQDFSSLMKRLQQPEYFNEHIQEKLEVLSNLNESDILNQPISIHHKRVPRRGDIGIQSLDERGKCIEETDENTIIENIVIE